MQLSRLATIERALIFRQDDALPIMPPSSTTQPSRKSASSDAAGEISHSSGVSPFPFLTEMIWKRTFTSSCSQALGRFAGSARRGSGKDGGTLRGGHDLLCQLQDVLYKIT